MQRLSRTTRSRSVAILFLILLHFSSVIAVATCYLPDGDLFASDTPCTSGGSASVCCGAGWTCLSDGVCSVTQDVSGQNETFYYRGTCTDQSWNDPACLNVCRDGSADVTGTNDNTSLPLVKCKRSDGQDYYCCSNDPNCNCGTQEGAVYSLAAQQPFTVTVISSSSWANSVTSTPPSSTAKITAPNTATDLAQTTTSSISTSTSASAAGASSSPSKGVTSSCNTNHVALGVGLGVGLGVAALLFITGICFFRIRRRRQAANMNNNPHLDGTYTYGPGGHMVSPMTQAPSSREGGHSPMSGHQGIYAQQQNKAEQFFGTGLGRRELPATSERFEADSVVSESQNSVKKAVELPGN